MKDYLLGIIIQKKEINYQPWDTSRDQGNQKSEPEPDWANSEELCQTATHTGDDAVAV